MDSNKLDFIAVTQKTAQSYLKEILVEEEISRAQLEILPSEKQQRGEADLWALYQQYHKRKVFEQFLPVSAQAQILYYQAERLRLWIFRPLGCLGTAQNIENRLKTYAKVDTASLQNSMAQAYKNITQTFLKKQIPQVLFPPFDAFYKARDNQKIFAQLVVQWINKIFSEEEDKKKLLKGGNIFSLDPEGDTKNLSKEEEKKYIQEALLKQQEMFIKEKEKACKEKNKQKKNKGKGKTEGAFFQPPTPICRQIYKVFSRKFDEVSHITSFVSPEELQELSLCLEEQEDQFISLHAHARKLQQVLRCRTKKVFLKTAEEGSRLSAQHLGRFLADDTYPIWCQPEKHQQEPVSVTLLVDNSGSMRGRPILMTALCAKFINRALGPYGIPLEILGYTTRHWQGGESLKVWKQAGKPEMPGRLNDLRHIIYKSFSQPWKIAAGQLPGMLQGSLLKENIDGEALLWAARRTHAVKAQQKLIIVISDGAPVDDATLANNKPSFLDNHLRFVINQLERDPTVTLLALGIGCYVDAYYKNSTTLHKLKDLGLQLFTTLIKFFTYK